MWLLAQEFPPVNSPLVITLAFAIVMVLREVLPHLVKAITASWQTTEERQKQIAAGDEKRDERERLGWLKTIENLDGEVKSVKQEMKDEDLRHQAEKARLEDKVEKIQAAYIDCLTKLAKLESSDLYLRQENARLTEDNRNLREWKRRHGGSDTIVLPDNKP